MHRLLERQLKRQFGDLSRVPKELSPLFQAIDDAYQHFDEDRIMIEHSLELSSNELNDLNRRLEGEIEQQERRAEKLERQNTLLADAKRAMLNLIEDERELEESLKKRAEELETLNARLASEKVRAEGILRYLRSIGEGVYATDRRGTVVFANDAATALIGQPSASRIGGESQELFRFCIGTDADSLVA